MIAVKLMGGLGNQMFQYAAALRLARLHHTSVVMDLGFFENIADTDTPRHYELNCFNIDASFLSPTRRPSDPQPSYTGARGKLLLARHKVLHKAWKLYRESGFTFDPHVTQLPDNSYLIGYWQSEKYFKTIRKIILDDFSFRDIPTGKNKLFLETISGCEAISLHVRRGDYISNPNANSFHGTKGRDYYDQAVSLVCQRCTNPVLYVFSDDIDWCKRNLQFDARTIYVEGNTKGCEDLRLMQACKHNIIANSSFSWWGAWLNRNPDKIVVAPKIWFNDESIDTSDIIPKEWIEI